MWRTIESYTADTLWREAFELIQNTSNAIQQTGRTGPTREVLHVGFTLKDPRQRWIFSRRPALNPAFALAEIIWIVRGRRDARFLSFFNRSLGKFAGTAMEMHGAYGFRLRKHFGIDQLESAFETLSANPSSRQAVLQLWDVRADLPVMAGQPRGPDIPCNTQSFLKVRSGRLEWMQLMRSNDIHLGLPHNIVQFTALQEVIAGWLGLQLGEYHHLSDSLHLYERDATTVTLAAQQVVPQQMESLALPKSDSERVFVELESAVECMIDENCSTAKLFDEARRESLPVAYQNILRVLTAEALRRRHEQSRAIAMMHDCTNDAYQLLWSNWLHRVRGNAAGAIADASN